MPASKSTKRSPSGTKRSPSGTKRVTKSVTKRSPSGTKRSPSGTKRVTKRSPSGVSSCGCSSMHDTMHRFKHGQLVFAKSKARPEGRKVTSRGQALAIGLAKRNKVCSIKKRS